MKKLGIILVLSFISFQLKAQDNQPPQYSNPIPVEVMVGSKSSLYQSITTKTFGKSKKLSFFNLVNYEVDYKSETPNDYIIQTLWSYSLDKDFKVGLGANLKAYGGFNPLFAITYTKFTKNIGVVIQPNIELEKEGLAELFAMFEWHATKFKTLNPYFRLQGITSYSNTNRKHDYSYLYLRLGVQYKHIKFGPALNIQHFGNGNLKRTTTNFGGFVGIELH